MPIRRDSLKKRIAKLEDIHDVDGEPLIIFLNCVTPDSSECVMAVIAGNTKRSGETLHREREETADDFVERIHQRARQLDCLTAEIELHGA